MALRAARQCLLFAQLHVFSVGCRPRKAAEPASTVSQWSRCAFGAQKSHSTTRGPTAAARPPKESRPRASLRAGSAIVSSRARTWDVHRQHRHERDFERSDEFDGKVVSVRVYRFYCLILRTQRGYLHIVTLCIARVLLCVADTTDAFFFGGTRRGKYSNFSARRPSAVHRSTSTSIIRRVRAALGAQIRRTTSLDARQHAEQPPAA